MEISGVRVLERGDVAALEAFLLPSIESSMFLVGNMRAAGLTDRGQTCGGTYAAAFKEMQICGVVAHYWNQNLVFQAPLQLEALCTAALERSRRPVKGLIGPAEQVSAARKLLGIDDANVQRDETEKLYCLELNELLVPDSLIRGKVRGRRIKARDLELVTRWRVEFAVELLGEEEGPKLQDECRAVVERKLRERRTWILEDRGRPLACSSFNTAIAEAVLVGGVWTPPGLRGRGYGRGVVAASLLDARSKGVGKAVLFTGESNIPAQKAYEALGFRYVGDYRVLLLKSPCHAALQDL